MTNIINQTKPNTCLACVLAMMVGETEQYVLDWFEHIDPPFKDDDAIIFLAHHGIYLCIAGVFKTDDDKGINLDGYDTLELRVDMTTNPAYLVVESPTREDLEHAVFWDCKHVLDPLKKDPQCLGDYKVKYVYPMMRTEERLRFDNSNL